MSRAICIPFHRYVPHSGQYYRVYFFRLLQTLDAIKGEYDKVYLIDSDWDFTAEDRFDLTKYGINYEIVPRKRQGHHWVQFKTAIPHIKEDYCLFLDNDVVIWKKGVVDNWFKQAESGKFVSAFDGSGGLREPMHRNFPILKDLDANRMGSYYFILNQEQMKQAYEAELAPIYYKEGIVLQELGYKTVEGDWQDSFGFFTSLVLPKAKEVYVIDDDRSSIYLEEVVMPEFDYSPAWLIKKDPETPKQLGYYHIRNGNLPIYALSSKMSLEHYGDYAHTLKITPKRELLRIVAWYWICGGSDFREDVFPILHDINVDPTMWASYLKEFKEYHGL